MVFSLQNINLMNDVYIIGYFNALPNEYIYYSTFDMYLCILYRIIDFKHL